MGVAAWDWGQMKNQMTWESQDPKWAMISVAHSTSDMLHTTDGQKLIEGQSLKKN